MFKNCRVLMRLVPILVCCSVCAGADDDFTAFAPEEADAFSLLKRTPAQEFLEDSLRYKVDEFRANYDLSQSQRAKLTLACRADVRRASQDLLQVHHPGKLRDLQMNLFGPDSFMAKAIPRILSDDQSSKYQSDIAEFLRLMHRSNIEGAIREIERHVVLQIPQQEALVELMLRELRPPQVGGDLDPLVVRFQLSQLPGESLKPVFDDDQWLKVQNVLAGFRKLAPLLKQRGLIGIDAEPVARLNETSQETK